ncbi:MAG TPA: polysaccharide deacetylase family protein [Actinoplanes sp.]|nr:polysaccharide deacetylase family protein [Actinoplanes sp.]
MNTDRPAPENSTPADDEAAEPTVALTVPGDSGDAEPTVTLSPVATPGPVAEAAEPTVDLSAPVDDAGEATVDLSAASGDLSAASDTAEETVALSRSALAAAVAEESEPTAVISAGAEPTIVVPKQRPAPEATVAVPVTAKAEPEATVALPIAPKVAPKVESKAAPEVVAAPESEATVALPIPPKVGARGDAESTVALPSVPRQRSAPTVTPPPADPTVALPVAPRTPPVVPPQSKPLTRRRLLWAVPAVAGTALVGGTIAALAGRGEPKAVKPPNLIVNEPPPAQSPAPKPTTPKPTTPVMPVPVHTLADFRKVVPGDAFPTDAIALTIDDGPHPVWTPQILRLLEKHDVPALFCMIGNQVLGHESTARDVVKDGHHIANHTWSHPLNVAELSARKALKEIHRAQDKIYSTTGYAPSLFRAPGGAWSKGLSESVSKSSVIPMDWTTDPRDWSRPGVAAITKRLLAAKPGQILLCHDGGGDRSQTLASLKTVIPALQAKGLKFVALT